MRRLSHLMLSAAFFAGMTGGAAAEAPQIMTTIKPLHSLVAAVTEGVTEPGLLVEGAGSPHTYALKPSQAAELQDADVVFWVGPRLEAFMQKPIETIGADAKAVALIDAPGITLIPIREGGSFEAHDHGDHGHDEGHAHGDEHDHDKDHAHDDDHAHDHDKDHAHGDDHAHDHDKDHAHGDEHAHDHDKDHAHGDDHAHDHDKDHAHGDDHAHDHDKDHAHGDDHAHGSMDSHIWLDPDNAKAMVRAIAATMSEHDPDNAARYQSNAETYLARLDQLKIDIGAELESVQDEGFIVFHDAYQYFEQRFGLAASGAITVSPEVIPGAARLSEIRAIVRDTGAHCVFSEPQFEPRLVSVVIEGTEAKSGVLDPLGAEIPAGPDHYLTLLTNLSDSLHTCLDHSH